jgi:hypothetical protein
MKLPIALPHISVLQEAFELDPSIPHGLRWKVRAARNTIVGDPAGRKHQNGYWEVRLNKVLFKTSRIVYKMYNNGEDPGWHEIDHIDRNKDNNDGQNLILATRAEQNCNKAPISASGFRNVTHDRRDSKRRAPWIAAVKSKGFGKFLGYYKSPYEAAIAAIAYKREMGLRYEYAPAGTM